MSRYAGAPARIAMGGKSLNLSARVDYFRLIRYSSSSTLVMGRLKW